MNNNPAPVQGGLNSAFQFVSSFSPHPGSIGSQLNSNLNNNDSFNSNFNDNNNNNNNNNNNQHNLTSVSYPSNLRFLRLRTSSCVFSNKDHIIFSSLNVRGLNNEAKFDSIFDDLFSSFSSVCALQETLLPPNRGSLYFKNLMARSFSNNPYRAYWDYNPADRNSGVSLILAPFISKYVQCIHKHLGRFIAADLYLPSTKLCIINIYNFQKDDFASKGAKFATYVVNFIQEKQRLGFLLIILGDFNLDPSIHAHALEQDRQSPAYFKICRFLFDNDFIDQFSKDLQGIPYASFYDNNHLPVSRIDQIWFSSDFITSLHADRSWPLPCTLLSTADDSFKLDHNCISVFFHKDIFIGHLPTHRVKQKGEWREYLDVKSATPDQWSSFKNSSLNLLIESTCLGWSASPTASLINSKWHHFVSAVSQAAKSSLPIKRVSSAVRAKGTNEALLIIKRRITELNRIFAFLTNFCFTSSKQELQTPLYKFRYLWNNPRSEGPKGFYFTLKKINQAYDFLIPPDSIPQLLSLSARNDFIQLRTHVVSLRNVLFNLRSIKEAEQTKIDIKNYETLRNINYSKDKSAFIASSLNKSKRSIVLDRAMITSPSAPNDFTLVTDPDGVKQAANEHFRTIAGLPPSDLPSLNDFPDVWRQYYSTLNVDSSIYCDLLSPPTDDEWFSTIKALPKQKAAGLLGFPYEILQQLPDELSLYLRDIVSACFACSSIPSD